MQTLNTLLRRSGVWWAGRGGVTREGRDLPEFKSLPQHLVFLGLHFLIFKMGRTE